MTRESLDAALSRAEPKLKDGAAMIVECLAMTGYDSEARARFVDWHRDHRGKIRAVAVVTDNRLWHMVVSVMSLASSQRMRAFETVQAADVWLSELAT